MWLATDDEPTAWDVTTTDFTSATNTYDFFRIRASLGNDGGTAQVVTLPPPTIEGMALPGEAVDWEIVGYGNGTRITFETRYPYDELSLHVRIDQQMISGTGIASMDGVTRSFTLTSAPYGDPADPTGSSVVEARYTRT
jgi:hypothetical protein